MRKSAFILTLLLALPAQAGFIQDSIDDGSLVLYHDYRRGDTQDLSGEGNHGTQSNTNWSSRGLEFINNTAAVLTVADAAELQLTEGTIVVFGEWHTMYDFETYVSKRDAGGDNYAFYSKVAPADRLYFWDGATGRFVAADLRGKTYTAVNFKSGEAAEGFIDGVSIGAFNDTSTVTTDDAPLLIGNYHLNSRNAYSPLKAILIFNDKLTATEHITLYAELSSMTWPTKGGGTAQGTYGAEVVVDGDMETTGTAAYTAGNSATLTKQADRVLGGDQILRVAHNGTADPNAFQNILTTGTEYRVTGWARGDGTGYPRLWDSTTTYWQGTTSTTWQHFDVTSAAGNQWLVLTCIIAVAGNCEFDNVTVTEVGSDHAQYTSDWNAKTSANIATGSYVDDTHFYQYSGAVKVEVQTVKGEDAKVIENTNDGITYIDGVYMNGDETQNAYGTWEWYASHGGSATTSFFIIINDALTDGYYIEVQSDESVGLYELAAGAPSTLGKSAASLVTADTWHKYKVTRRQSDGQFSFYVDDTLVTAASGSNPVADTTVTSTDNFGWNVDNGDKICLGTKTGNYAIVKKHGVQ
jgi:hypothetical protein